MSMSMGEMREKAQIPDDAEKEAKSRLHRRLLRFYEFNGRNFIYLYSRFPKLRKALDSGNYVFVNGKVVLKSKSCLRIENGKLTTIDFSDDDIPAYCLGLISSYPKRDALILEAKKISSLKDITSDNLFVMIGGGGYPPNDFCKALIHFMSSRNVTVEQLAEETGLAEKTIQRMRNDPDRTPSIESVIVVCVGLHLDAYDSDMLLYLAGHKLTNRRIDRIYRLFLNFAYKESVRDCNEMLIRLGEKPLTSLRK